MSELATTPIRLGVADLAWATEVLTEAFQDDPTTEYLFAGSKKRERSEYFMRCMCLYTFLYGEGYATPARDGVSLWLTPGETKMTPGRMYKAGMFKAPLRFGWSGFKRFLNFAGFADEIHAAAASMPHYYLFGMGVHPSAQGGGGGTLLLEHMIERVDAERLPIYLETQSERNVGYYRRFGFKVVGDGEFPRSGGHYNWGMLRSVAAHPSVETASEDASATKL